MRVCACDTRLADSAAPAPVSAFSSTDDHQTDAARGRGRAAMLSNSRRRKDHAAYQKD